MEKKKKILVLFLLVAVLLIINYAFLDTSLEKLLNTEKGIVERVIDGDTIIVNGNSVRLLGINAPEKNEFLYEEAKKHLEDLILGKEVELRFTNDRYDKYSRKLAYVYLEKENKKENINLKLVEEGFANFYFPEGRDENYKIFKKAWEECINKNINLCEKSNNLCEDCIVFSNSNSIKNYCGFNCNVSEWIVKGEGRQKFIFHDIILKNNETAFFNLKLNPQDTLFLRDNYGKLVAWKDVSY